MTPLRLRMEDVPADLVAGIVTAHGIDVGPSPPTLAAALDALLLRRSAGDDVPATVRAAVRDLLRHGGFKPTGRSKPASEFLAQAAARGEFPRICNVVDVCNLLSLESGLPISVLDLDLADPEHEGLVLRTGRDGEGYVFNAAGHTIDVAGLLCVARDGRGPVANPVKDSAETKIRPTTRHVLAVIYGTRTAGLGAAVAPLAARFAALLRESAAPPGPAPPVVTDTVLRADA